MWQLAIKFWLVICKSELIFATITVCNGDVSFRQD